MQTRTRTLLVAAATAAVVLVAAPAFAHVTMETENERPGATSIYTISVPNEDDAADTVKIEVELPEGLDVTDFKPGKGWTMAVDEGVLVIDGGKLGPGDRRDFRFTGVNPGEPGELVFPAIQTYSDGEEVRWAGEEDSDRPAARVTISGEPLQPEPAAETEPAPSPSQAPASDFAASQPVVVASATPSDEAPAEPTGDSGRLSPLTFVVLIAIALGLFAAGLAYGRRRRRG